MSEFKLELSKVADTLVNQSTVFQCSLEEAWEKWMHPLITERFTFEEVKGYIDRKIELGEEMQKQLQ